MTQVVVAQNTRHRSVHVSPTIRSFLSTTSSIEVENEADIIVVRLDRVAEGEFVEVPIVEEEPPQLLIAQEVEMPGRVADLDEAI